MAADSAPLWTLRLFDEAFDEWVEREQPPQPLRVRVLTWLLSRCETPYEGVRREPEFDNLWFGPVPDSRHGSDMVVACAYWIEEAGHVVRCDSITTLSLPL